MRPSSPNRTSSHQAIEPLEPRVLFSGVEYMDGLPGVFDVTTVDVSAVTSNGRNVIPDDGLDDTEAINAVLAAAGADSLNIVYFPDGVYNVSGTLQPVRDGVFIKRTHIQGQSEAGTIFKLTSNTFTDPLNPEPVWDFGPPAGSSPSADNFHNIISDLTIDVQSNNDGAHGIDFFSNNSGLIKNVTVQAASGTGKFGIDLTQGKNGPLFVKDVTVNGFDEGIVGPADNRNSQTFENITLNDQDTTGMRNGSTTGGRQGWAIHGLTSSGSAQVFDADYESPNPSTVLIDANLTGTAGAGSVDAIRTGGISYIRDVTTSGFNNASVQSWFRMSTGVNTVVTNPNGSNIESASYRVGGGITDGFATPFGETPTGLDLPFNDTPVVPNHDVATEWIKAGNLAGDDTAAVQAAIDTPGVKTVVLDASAGDYVIDSTLILRGDVERIIAIGGQVRGSGTIRLDDGAANNVLIDRFYQPFKNRISIEHNSDRTLVVANGEFKQYTNTALGTGDVYMDNVVINQVAMKHQDGWFKQLNQENLEDALGQDAYFLNDGGTAVILGLKTEFREDDGNDPYTFVKTINGGSTELLGGMHLYNSGSFAAGDANYDVVDANFGVARLKLEGGPLPPTYVNATQNGSTVNSSLTDQSYYITRDDNAAPTAAADTAATNRDAAITVSVLANDTDPDVGDTLSIDSVVDGAFGSVTISGSDVVYTPNTGFVGDDVFAYTIADGNGGFDTARVTVTVSRAPEAFVTGTETNRWVLDVDNTDSGSNPISTTTTELRNGAAIDTADFIEGSASVKLDGNNDSFYLFTGDGQLTDSFSQYTVSFWFKAADTTGRQMLFEEGGASKGIAIRLNGSTLEAVARGSASNAVTASLANVTAGQWHLATVRFDSGTLTLNLNGTANADSATTTAFTTVNNHGNPSAFGARASSDAFNDGSSSPLEGWIDDARIYDGEVLSDAQIDSIYDALTGPKSAFLTGTETHSFTLDSGTTDSGSDPIGTGNLTGGAFIDVTESIEGTASARFDGVNDRLSFGTGGGKLTNPFSEYTVAFWFKADDTNGLQMLYDEGGRNNGLSLRLNGSTLEAAAVSVNQANVTTVSVTGVTAGTWHLATARFDNGTLTVSLDGSANSNFTVASFSTVGLHNDNSSVGAQSGSDTAFGPTAIDPFAGWIDGLRIYDGEVLTNGQVDALYRSLTL